jgi:dienelactone hydrolase
MIEDDVISISSRHVRIPAGSATLEGDLALPPDARGLVVFAHGSGSGRHSPRNGYVADALNRHGLGTLLADLLTADEEAIDRRTRHLRFDIPLLADRLDSILAWTQAERAVEDLPVGCFGASAGAAAALIAAARQAGTVRAVVSRGGRPDLAGAFLPRVRAPVLLIVGERDPEVLRLNEQALGKLNARSRLATVPGATHLFEEPGTLEEAARLAAAWFDIMGSGNG